MPVFDVKTASGKLISTITVGHKESTIVGQRYDESYLGQFREMYNEEVFLIEREEVDFHAKDNKRIN